MEYVLGSVMAMPDLTVTFTHAAHLCRRLESMAIQTYTRAPDGHHDVRMNIDLNRSASFEDVYESHTRGRRRLDPDLESDLYNNGFCEFSPLGYGTGTWVYAARHGNGHDYAIRASFKSAEQRPLTPLVLQPYYTHRQKGLIVEVLPLVQILALDDTPVPERQGIHGLDEVESFVLDTIIRQYMRAASCIPSPDVPLPCKDTAILPDGTPLQVDPGAIRYGDNIDVRRAVLHFRDGVRPMPQKQLQWFAGGQPFKQDRFFLNPFDHKPVYRGLAL